MIRFFFCGMVQGGRLTSPLKHFDEAVELSRRAVEINPDGSDPYARYASLAVALANLGGDEAGAHEALRSYLETSPAAPRSAGGLEVDRGTFSIDVLAISAMSKRRRTFEGLRKAGLREE